MKIDGIKVSGNSGTGIVINIGGQGDKINAPTFIDVKCNSCGHIEHLDATHGMSASQCNACGSDDITVGQATEDTE